MRATFARVALVVFVSTGLAGCKSMSGLAFWRKKPDNTAVAEAPKFNPNSQLPSAGVNPNNSLASVPGYSSTNAAAAAAAAGAAAAGSPTAGSSYAATPATYQ